MREPVPARARALAEHELTRDVDEVVTNHPAWLRGGLTPLLGFGQAGNQQGLGHLIDRQDRRADAEPEPAPPAAVARTFKVGDFSYSSPAIANGVLYVANRNQLFAIAAK